MAVRPNRRGRLAKVATSPDLFCDSANVALRAASSTTTVAGPGHTFVDFQPDAAKRVPYTHTSVGSKLSCQTRSLLFHIAKADGEVHRQEEQFLGEVAKLFGFTVSEFNSIKARHLVAAKRNPYDVLGVKPSISDEDLKSHYRMLLADTHSEQLIARGVPKEFTVIAIEKRAALSDAYDAIMKERSI